MKKGFTLIELLAVIVILAIFALISIPVITGIISKSVQKAFAADTSAIFRAIEYKMTENDSYDFSQVDVSNIKNELNISKPSYKFVKIKQLSNGDFMVVIRGENRWENLVAYGTDDDIKVIDTTSKQYATPPTITLNGANLLDININDEYVELGATASDEAGNELDVYIFGTVNTNQLGQNTITYYTIDEAGNETEITRTVNVTVINNFAYTGNYETWVVPVTGRYKIEVFGAQGGGNGGKGGYAYGEVNLTAGQTLYGFVGGQGKSDFKQLGAAGGGDGGWNGGGSGGITWDTYNRPVGDPSIRLSSGGGGATDIRIGGLALTNRIIVAGGGGGAPSCALNSGDGGGSVGQDGVDFATNSTIGAKGGTQTDGGLAGNISTIGGGIKQTFPPTNGSLGQGGTAGSIETYGNNPATGGGGGGGYYGGGGGSVAAGWGQTGTAGGGSSYIGGMINDATRGTTAGINTGNGKITIKLVS
ncbi:MAG: glycine-rich protein [Ignavibacteriales bacterium]